MGGPTAMTADSLSSLSDQPLRTSEYRLNLARSRKTDRRHGYENRSPVFSYERSPNQYPHFLDWGVTYPHFSGRIGQQRRSEEFKLWQNRFQPDPAGRGSPRPQSRWGGDTSSPFSSPLASRPNGALFSFWIGTPTFQTTVTPWSCQNLDCDLTLMNKLNVNWRYTYLNMTWDYHWTNTEVNLVMSLSRVLTECQNARLNKCDFRSFLNLLVSVVNSILSGRQFHAAWLKLNEWRRNST